MIDLDVDLYKLQRIRSGDVRLIARERKGARSTWLQWLVVVVGIDNDVIHVATHKTKAEALKDFENITEGKKRP